MSEINLVQRLRTDSQFRESLRTAETSEQKISILEDAGFSSSDIHNAADRISDSSMKVFNKLFAGMAPCLD